VTLKTPLTPEEVTFHHQCNVLESALATLPISTVARQRGFSKMNSEHSPLHGTLTVAKCSHVSYVVCKICINDQS